MSGVEAFELHPLASEEWLGHEPAARRIRGPAATVPPARVAHLSSHVLAGGVVAYNEEQNVGTAIQSLLAQDLPDGYRWGTIWVVASGCTDGTARVVSEMARLDDRIRLIAEPARNGKAHALQQVFARALGDALVLLNADACAEPGAIRELWHASRSLQRPFGVMGQPTSPPARRGETLGAMMELLWSVHHEFHREVVPKGQGLHLSDELMLVSLPEVPTLPSGVINDGSYLAAWVAERGGECAYAERARVSIQVPRTFKDHLNQRRRILVGHRQVSDLVGVAPTTLSSYAFRHPREGIRILRQAIRARSAGLRELSMLVLGETTALALAAWDGLPPRRDHARWVPVETTAPRPLVEVRRETPDRPPTGLPLRNMAPTSEPDSAEGRIRSLLRVAERFRTGVALDEMARMLPPETCVDPDGLSGWLAGRPDLARVEGGRVYSPRGGPDRTEERRARGTQFEQQAHWIVEQHLGGASRWVRSIAITGSVAYGEPEAGDDLDFVVVTRKGALWLFLAYAYLAVRFRYRPDPARGRPEACFNFVVDESRAVEEFARPRGFLVARETLTARPIRGEDYYRGLLGASPWLRSEIPRLYADRSSPTALPPAEPVPWVLRGLNALMYPLLATYLQLVGLRGNARFPAERRSDLSFRTDTHPNRLAFLSDRFERLEREFPPSAAPPAPDAAAPRERRREVHGYPARAPVRPRVSEGSPSGSIGPVGPPGR